MFLSNDPLNSATVIRRTAGYCGTLVTFLLCLCAPLRQIELLAEDFDDERWQLLEERLDAVECENEALRQAMVERNLPPSPLDVAAETAVDKVFTDGADDHRIRSIILDVYQEQEARRQQEEAWKKQLADEQAAKDLVFKGSWKHGLQFETKDKDFKVHVGGRTQFDMAWFGVPQDIQQDPTIANKWGDGVDFRRVRIKIDGTMYEFIDWAAQFDVMNSTRDGTNNKALPAPTDLWWTFTKLPGVGNLRVGNHKEPIGFEHLVSSRFQPFMERSFNQDSFYGGFNNGFTPGATLFNTALDERMTWAWGVYKPVNNVFAYNTNPGDWASTARATFLPYYENEGEELLHLGVSGRAASTFNETVRFRTRGPERSGISSVWPLPADTGTFRGNEMYWVNAELVGVHGPWTFQSEYLTSFVQGDEATAAGVPVNTVFYHGGYAQVLYYLTGDHDNYNRKTGAFDRVIPADNAHISNCGPSSCYPWGWLSCGAWQVGVRYNYLDLNDEGINGGVLQDVTTGLNWFLNPNMKLQWNYSATHRESGSGIGDGFIHGFGMRIAHDF